MTRIGSLQVSILTWLVDYEHATASGVGHACGIAFFSARGRLIFLQTQRLVSSRYNDSIPPRRIYALTAEGRQRTICDPRSTAKGHGRRPDRLFQWAPGRQNAQHRAVVIADPGGRRLHHE